MTTLNELYKMDVKELLQYKENLTVGFPKNFNEVTIFVIDKIIEEKNNKKQGKKQ